MRVDRRQKEKCFIDAKPCVTQNCAAILRRPFYAFKAILLGLAVAQILATIQVYLSNNDLYRTLLIIQDAGYLAVPNQNIIPSLKRYGPAFLGGLFFTFSVGLGVSFVTFLLTWVWDRIFSRHKILLVILFLLWIGCLVGINISGFNPLASLYFLLVPLAVSSALQRMPEVTRQEAWFAFVVYMVPISLLAILWGSQTNNQLFVNVRDNLLLSNPVGTKVNDFYYQYTLYPAEVFKPLGQKIIKTCKLEYHEDKDVEGLLKPILLNHDYLPVESDSEVDLMIQVKNNVLLFVNKKKVVLQASLKEFISQPGRILNDYSAKIDRYLLFRHFTFLSIVIFTPIILYVLVCELFRFVLALFFKNRVSLTTASMLCFFFGLTLLVPLTMNKEEKVNDTILTEALKSERWQDRVRALRLLSTVGMEIGDSQVYRQLLASPNIPERYWLTRLLGDSHLPETYEDLLAFLDDPHPNVVCMAFYALGRRGDTRAVDEIMKRIEVSDHWYEQWYAYKALRSLGWRQKKVRP